MATKDKEPMPVTIVDPKKSEKPTKLAHVNDPKTLTDAKIKEIAGTTKTETDDPEMQANADLARTLKKDRAEAKAAKNGQPHNDQVIAGQGGAAYPD